MTTNQRERKMLDAIDRLRSLQVSDVMTKQVVHISLEQTMAEVIDVFAQHQISAAPVVDRHGTCVGILSTTDFLKRDVDAHGVCGPARRMPGSGMVEDVPASYMTTPVQSVAPDAPLLSAATVMCHQHFHRLLVLDEQQRVVGVLSTMDVVAALLNSIDEMDVQLMQQVKAQQADRH